MQASRKPLDPTLPAPLAHLSAELLARIAGEAVTSREPIEIEDIDDDVDKLLRPFQSLQLLDAVARGELMRVNTFTADFNESYHVPRVRRSEPDGDGKTKATLVMAPEARGPTQFAVSEKSRYIRHLKVEMDIHLQGAVLSGNPAPFEPQVYWNVMEFLHSLAGFFPALQSLDVEVSNDGKDPSRSYQPLPGKVYTNEQHPMFKKSEAWERMIAMEFLLILVAATRSGPSLKSKRVTFIHNPNAVGHDSRPPVIDGSQVASVESLPADNMRRPTPAHRARAAVMYFEMRDRPRGNSKRLKRCGSPKERRTFFDMGAGKADAKLISQVLKYPEAVVTIPVKKMGGVPGDAI